MIFQTRSRKESQYMEDDKAAKDIRILHQKELIINEIRNKARKPWMDILIRKSRLLQKYFGTNAVISTFIGGLTYIVIGLRALKGYISLGNVGGLCTKKCIL